MRRFATSWALALVCLGAAMLLPLDDIHARGGRGGFGGGGFGGGGGRAGGGGGRVGGRSGGLSGGGGPSMSRMGGGGTNVSRPNVSGGGGARPNGARPSGAAGSRPSVQPGGGGRPSIGNRPNQGQLQNFLDLPVSSGGNRFAAQSDGGGRFGAGRSTGVAGGGAAAEFLRNNPSPSQRPQGFPGSRFGGAGGLGAGERPGVGNRPGVDDRPFANNRPDRIDNRQEWQNNRVERRQQTRDQFNDNHPRWDFWSDHPHWAAWRINRPYRWATWGLMTAWFPWSWSQPVYYDYGDNVYYQGDTVYYGDEAIASSEEYAQQAQTIAASAPDIPAETTPEEWMGLGVFAITQDGQASGPPPTMYVQLQVNKDGVITGTLQNLSTEGVQQIDGAVDKQSQRSAWTVAGKSWPIMETGISNLTRDEAPALVHFEDGTTQQWLLIRMPEDADVGQPQ